MGMVPEVAEEREAAALLTSIGQPSALRLAPLSVDDLFVARRFQALRPRVPSSGPILIPLAWDVLVPEGNCPCWMIEAV